MRRLRYYPCRSLNSVRISHNLELLRLVICSDVLTWLLEGRTDTQYCLYRMYLANSIESRDVNYFENEICSFLGVISTNREPTVTTFILAHISHMSQKNLVAALSSSGF